MPLSADYTKIKNHRELFPTYYDEVYRQDRENPVTESLVFATIIVGFNTITEKNVEEFYDRLYAWQVVNGAGLRTAEGEPLFISFAQVRGHIGLRTNASPRTKAQFAKLIAETLYDAAKFVRQKETT